MKAKHNEDIADRTILLAKKTTFFSNHRRSVPRG